MSSKVIKLTNDAIGDNYCGIDKWFVSIVLCPKKIGMVFDNKLDATNFHDAALSRYPGADIEIGRKKRISASRKTNQRRTKMSNNRSNAQAVD